MFRDPKHQMTPGHIADDAPQCIHHVSWKMQKKKKNETANSVWPILPQLTVAAISKTSLEAVFGLTLLLFSPKNDCVDWPVHILAKSDSD